MPHTAPTQFGKLLRRVLNEIGVGHFVNKLFEAALSGGTSGHGRLVPGHFVGKNRSDQAHELATTEKMVDWGGLADQRGEFSGNRIRRSQDARRRAGLGGCGRTIW